MSLRLPDQVTLPTCPRAPAGQVYSALRASKQRVLRWRRAHGFPASEGRALDVQAVAQWLSARGVRIEWS